MITADISIKFVFIKIEISNIHDFILMYSTFDERFRSAHLNDMINSNLSEMSVLMKGFIIH
jgi:hypothetical protein